MIDSFRLSKFAAPARAWSATLWNRLDAEAFKRVSLDRPSSILKFLSKRFTWDRDHSPNNTLNLVQMSNTPGTQSISKDGGYFAPSNEQQQQQQPRAQNSPESCNCDCGQICGAICETLDAILQCMGVCGGCQCNCDCNCDCDCPDCNC